MMDDLQKRMANLSYCETKPMAAMVEFTYRCNQSCRHCYVLGMDTSRELSAERLADVVAEAADEGIMFAALSGGEFMVRPDWRIFTDRVKPLKLALRLFSNLTYADKETADYVAGLAPVFVETTLFSGEPAVHDSFVRSPGAFETTVGAIKLLRERRVDVLIKHEVTDLTWPSFGSLEKIVDELGAGFSHSIYIGPNLAGRPDPYYVRPSDETARAYFELCYDGVKKIKVNREDDICGPEAAERRRMGRVVTCMSGRNSAVIGPDGTVYPCALLRVPFGNVADRPFGEVWRSDAAEEFRELESRPLPECASCEYDAICRRCPGYSLLDDGAIDRPSSEHCRIARIESEVVKGLSPVEVS